MCQEIELQRAQHGFREFVRGLSAFQAQHVTAGGRMPDIEPFVEVGRSEAVDVFLSRNPEFENFRRQLLSEDRFFFVEEQWEQVTEENSGQ